MCSSSSEKSRRTHATIGQVSGHPHAPIGQVARTSVAIWQVPRRVQRLDKCQDICNNRAAHLRTGDACNHRTGRASARTHGTIFRVIVAHSGQTSQLCLTPPPQLSHLRDYSSSHPNLTHVGKTERLSLDRKINPLVGAKLLQISVGLFSP